MHININTKYKSIPKDINFKLSSFSVITGKNGSGKTHLLEALANPSISKIVSSTSSQPITNIKLIKFGELNPSINETCSANDASQFFKDPWHQITNLKSTINSFPHNHPYKIDNKGYIDQQSVNIKNLIYKIMDSESVGLMEITEDHVIRHASIILENSGQLFTSQLARIFKAYHTRYIKNEFQDFLNRKHGQSRICLTESEFIITHGPKPWETINNILLRAGLSHKVIGPDQSDIDSDYTLRLVESSSGAEISANDLSTGEKVLMSLALAIYNTADSNVKCNTCNR